MGFIAESAGGFCCAGRDGKIYFKTIGEDEEELPLRLFKTYKFSEEYKVSKVAYEDGVRNFEFGNDEGNTLWLNQDNIFITDEEQVQKIYNKLNGMTINSFEGTVIINPALDVGDKLIIDGKSVIYQGEMSLNQRFIAEIKSKFSIKQRQETTVKKESQKAINRRVQSRIDEAEGKITQLIEQSAETSQKLSKHEQTIDSITDTISSIETKVETVENKADTAQQVAEGAQSSADNAQQTADSAVSKIETTTEKLTEVERTIDGITQTVSETITKVETVEGKADNAQNTADNVSKEIVTTNQKVSSLEQTVDGFNQTISNIETKVENVEGKADKAQSTADTANSNAQNAQESADNANNEIVTTKQKVSSLEQTVDGFNQTVSNIETKVETVETKADDAQSTANSANTKADNAQTTANSATTKAENAQSTANTANTNAQNAQSTAEQANVNAQNAQNIADEANTNAQNAQNTADEAVTQITTTNTKVSELEQTVDGFKQSVSAVEEKVVTVETKVDDAQTSANKANEKIDGLQVGSRNLALNTKKFFDGNFSGNTGGSAWTSGSRTVEEDNATPSGFALKVTYYTDGKTVKEVNNMSIKELNEIQIKKLSRDYDNSAGGYMSANNLVGGLDKLIKGETYTVSFWIKANREVQLRMDNVIEGQTIIDKNSDGVIGTQWQKIVVVFKWTDTSKFRTCFYIKSPANSIIWLSSYMLEKGTIPTDWTPAPEDIETTLTNEYYTKTETNSQITQKADEITSEVSQTISTAKQEAIDSANASTDNKLKNYSTTVQMNSAITQKANEITSSVNLKFNSYDTSEEVNSKIQQKADTITTEVNKKVNNSEFSTKIQQNWQSVQIAWNNISQYIQFLNAQLQILDSNDKLLMALTSSGQYFYNNGVRIGMTGTNSMASDSSKRGIVFDLDANGSYMTWASRTSSSENYLMQFTYAKSAFSKFREGLNLGANLNTQGNNIVIEDSDGIDGEIMPYTSGFGIKLRSNREFAITNNSNSTIMNFKDDGISGYRNLNMNGYDIKNAGNVSSDGRLKKKIYSSKINALDKIMQIKHREFVWKKDGKQETIGYIAQELEKVDATYVQHNYKEDEEGNVVEDSYELRHSPLIATATKAIQEQQKIIEEQKKTINKQQQFIEIVKDKLGLQEEYYTIFSNTRVQLMSLKVDDEVVFEGNVVMEKTKVLASTQKYNTVMKKNNDNTVEIYKEFANDSEV